VVTKRASELKSAQVWWQAASGGIAPALRGGAMAVIGMCVLLAGSARVAAQAPESAMGQGEANINVRSDVKLAIKGTRSTTTVRLQQLTDVVTDQMPELRKCYRDLIAKRPTTVGSIAIRITLEQGNDPPQVEIKETGGSEPDLTGCVRRVLTRAPFKKVERPAAAIATLEFENTRAKGQAEMEQRRETTERIDVREREGGGFEASWSANDGKVAFTVGSGGSREAVEAALRTLRDSFAGFADCRRRSEKGGLSPAGDLEVQLQLQRGGKNSAKVTSSTVAHERAVPCVQRAFGRLKFADAPPGQRLDVRVTFGG
jgi:hypothetical protein